jgi:PAS domain S-box-containing protein
MIRTPPRADADPASVDAMQAFQDLIRRLVKDASELRAIEAGEVDAIMDPVSGKAILLPTAQAGLRESEARMRSLLALNSDGDWEQDEHYCFTSYTHAAIGITPIFDGEDIVGKTFWALPFNNMSKADWRAHRSRLEHRATFRDLELRYVDRAGEAHEISVSGEPVFDVRGKFTGYRGVMQDITARRRAKQLPKSGHTVANNLLAALPREHYQRLLAALEPVTLTYGEVLYEPGQRIGHVYFPEDSFVSLLTQVEVNHSLEVGLVGREGMVGIALALGADISTNRALVQGTGTAMRMEATRFSQEFLQSVPLQRELYRFIHVRMAQVAQTAACNHFHRVEARLARWLLMTRDRTSSNDLYLTQEFLADMLGVRRAGVTVAARSLQKRKLIHYRRGHINILNRRGLEAAACVCYQIIKKMRF